MKLIKLVVAVLAVSTLLISCKDDTEDTGKIQLNFVATANNQPFVLGNTYTSPDGLPCKYDNFKFYISNVRLHNGSALDTILDAAIINYSNQNPAKSVTIDVPPGSYSGFSLGIGLDSLQNMVDPTNYPSSSPFSSVNGMYWGMQALYRFVILEGGADTIDNGINEFYMPIVMHCGANNMYKNVDFSNFTIDVKAGEVTNVNINFDFNQIYYSATDTINLKVKNITHTSDDNQLANTIMTNFANALHANHQ